VAKYLFFWADEHRASAAKAKSDASRESSQIDDTVRGQSQRRADTESSAMKDALDSEIVQKSASYVLSAYHWCAQTYTRYAHPYVWKFLVIEAKIASAAASLVVRLVSTTWSEVLSPLLFNVLAPAGQDLYSTQVLPFFMSNVYPWYKTNLEAQVNRAYASAASTWEKDYEAWFDHNVLDVTDFAIGRLHYVSYFTVRFFSSENLLGDLQDALVYMQGFIPSVIDQLSSLPALNAQLGEHARLVVTVLVYSCVGLFAYIVRRVLLGVVSLVLIMVLSPLLLVVYCLAKLAKPFLPKKKSAKKATASRPVKGAAAGATAAAAVTTAPPRATRSASTGAPSGALSAPPLAPVAAGYGNPRLAAVPTRSQQPDGGKSTGRAAPMPSTSSSQGSMYNDTTPSSSQEWNAYEP
jgi:Na+-transporting methylmalonyl-CoA/oxaloacetate decarboxylase gamma subunit